MNNNHFIDINNLSKKEILGIIELAKRFKKAKYDNALPNLLEGKSLAMIFELPSSRTRISFENAITSLGGHAIYLRPGEIHLGSRETLQDTGKVLSRLCDFIIMRAWEHSSILELAESASVPVFNALSNYNHPSQALSDIMTISENLNKDYDEIVITFIGDRTNVCHSLLNISAKLNIEFRQIAPKRYQINNAILKNTLLHNPDYNKEIIRSDKTKFLKNSDIIYTDLWWWITEEDEKDVRKNAFLSKYQVSCDKITNTKNPNVLFMHCLPANREMEVTSEVLDSKMSLAFEQVENRLYIQMALLTYYNNQSLNFPEVEVLQKHRDNILEQLNKMRL